MLLTFEPSLLEPLAISVGLCASSIFVFVFLMCVSLSVCVRSVCVYGVVMEVLGVRGLLNVTVNLTASTAK